MKAWIVSKLADPTWTVACLTREEAIREVSRHLCRVCKSDSTSFLADDGILQTACGCDFSILAPDDSIMQTRVDGL